MKKKFKDKIIELLKANVTPREIARGLAIGVFVGVSPLIGLHALLGIALAFVFRANKLAAVAGTQVSLPWFQPFILLLNLQLGTFALSGKWGWPHLELSIKSVEAQIPAFALGTLILGSIGAIITYCFSIKIVEKIAENLKPEK